LGAGEWTQGILRALLTDPHSQPKDFLLSLLKYLWASGGVAQW
jgi:hypothetical protein